MAIRAGQHKQLAKTILAERDDKNNVKDSLADLNQLVDISFIYIMYSEIPNIKL